MAPFSSSTKHKPPSQRQLKVGEEIRHALSHILMREDFADPAMKGASVTVSEVRISPDLKNATAYVMPLGGSNKEAVVDALNRLAPQLRHLATHKMPLRFSPRIFFKLDETYDEASRIDALLRRPEVKRDLGADETSFSPDDDQ